MAHEIDAVRTLPALQPETRRPGARRVSRAADGLAGRGSVAWKINSEVVLLLGWGRAILMQLAHPLVAAGVADHSLFLSQPRGRLKRLSHTLEAMMALTFGTAAEVAEAARGINAIHDYVHGEIPCGVGIFSAGHAYSAHDPALLRWVHATLLDTFPRIYELYVGPLTDAEKDRYCVEAAGLEPLLGIPSGYLPRSMAELGRYMDSMLASGQIQVGETAHDLGDAIVHPPAPRLAGPLLWLAQLPAVGLLPQAVREGYGFSWDARRETALRRSARVVRRLLPLLPALVRYWPAARTAFARG